MGRPKGSANKSKQEEMMDGENQTEAVETLPAIRSSVPAAITPMGMLEKAVTSGASMEVVEKLLDLQDRWDAKQARRAFDEAMANAKAEIPSITKNRAVDFTTQKGRTNYKYEDLDSVASAVGPALSKYGLSYRYRATSNVNEPVTVTCIISHRAGHFEELTLAAGRDDSGNKNSIQAISSTMTYLQRISLKAALGLAVSNDDDGQTSEEKAKDNGPPRQPAQQQRAQPQPEQAHDGTPPPRQTKAEIPATIDEAIERRMDDARKSDPISSGPPRTTAPKPAPKEDGPSDPGPRPHKIPGTGETYDTWAAKYQDMIRTSPDISVLYKWIDLNNEPLGKLARGKPSVAGDVKKTTEKVMQAFRDAQEKSEKKAAKKAAPPADMDAPGDMDGDAADAPTDPESILRAIDTELAAVEDADQLQITWESACEPLLAKLDFPPDIDVAQSYFDKHSKRLGGD